MSVVRIGGMAGFGDGASVDPDLAEWDYGAYDGPALFAHRDILRMLTVRWISLPALEARRLALETGSVSILG